MRRPSLSRSKINLKNEKRAVNIFFVFVLLVYTGSLLGQNNLKISDFSLDKFEEYGDGLKFENVKQKYLKKKISPCNLTNDQKARVNQKISKTIYYWNTVNIVTQLKDSKIKYGQEYKRPFTNQEVVESQNINEYQANRNQHTQMSPVVTEENDTLLIFRLSKSIGTIIVCKNIKEINSIYNQLSKINTKESLVLNDTVLKLKKSIALLIDPLSPFHENYEKRREHIEELNNEFSQINNNKVLSYEYHVKKKIPNNHYADMAFGINKGKYQVVLAMNSDKIFIDKDISETTDDKWGRSHKIQGSNYFSIYNKENDSFLGLLFFDDSQNKLYFLNATLAKKRRESVLKLKEDVILLKNHISALREEDLSLNEVEKKALNTNIQSRIIQSLDSLKLPKKIYLASVNRAEPAAQTKSYFYAVEKNPDNRFFGLGEEYDDFPSMDPLIDDLIFIDSIPLKINRNKLKKIIRSTDYFAHFYHVYRPKTKYTRVHGGLTNLDSTETLFMTTSEGGSFSNSKNPLYLEEFPSYTDFRKNFLLNVKEKDFPLSDLDVIGFSIDENHIYSKDSIRFVLKIKKGSNSTPRTSRYGGTVYGTNKQAMYDYAKKFHKFYWNWKKEVEEKKRKKELAAEQEKEQKKQELAKKYGKKYVDAFYKMKIIVGMHKDLVNAIVSKLYTVGSRSSSRNGDYYRLDPRYGTGWVSVWIKNDKVTAVTYH